MFWRPLIMAAVAVVAQAAEVAAPSEFYIVSEFFSDDGALFYYRLIEVKQAGPDSTVRYVRIAPSNVFCPRLVVQAKEATARGKSPVQLIQGNNPCAVKPKALDAALNRCRRRVGVFETISFGIVARCGHSSVSLGLPRVESVDLDRMKSSHPEMVRLWDLGSDITDSVFGPNDTFHDRSAEDDLVLQRTGEKLVPELISGRYDEGLATAVKGNVGRWKAPSFQALLASYRGPITATEAKASYVQLLNSSDYHLTRFVTPKYPSLAMHAGIQGKVELQLAVEAATGEVHRASATSGHPLLAPSAIDAAQQWRFEARSVNSETVNVTVEFALRCQ